MFIDSYNILQAINNIEERLAILHPNPELENDWEEIKNLGNQYRELEKNILEKEKMWELLKKQNHGIIDNERINNLTA